MIKKLEANHHSWPNLNRVFRNSVCFCLHTLIQHDHWPSAPQLDVYYRKYTFNLSLISERTTYYVVLPLDLVLIETQKYMKIKRQTENTLIWTECSFVNCFISKWPIITLLQYAHYRHTHRFLSTERFPSLHASLSWSWFENCMAHNVLVLLVYVPLWSL